MLLGFYLICWHYAHPFSAPLGSKFSGFPLVLSLGGTLQKVVNI